MPAHNTLVLETLQLAVRSDPSRANQRGQVRLSEPQIDSDAISQTVAVAIR
jgi:hypothetical protein